MSTLTTPSFATLLQSSFSQRLMNQRQASPNTIGSYRDTFRLLLRFAQARLEKQPWQFELSDVDAPLIAAFLDDMEEDRKIAARTRNLRLTAIRSFFRYAALEAPEHSAQIQRVLAIPSKRHTRSLISFLSQQEVEALLAAPDQRTWLGRRDHVLLLLVVQTGMRLSEMTGLQRGDVTLGTGAHVRVMGKGRKERSIPLTKRTTAILNNWMKEPEVGSTGFLCPSARGGKLSADAVQYILKKHIATAATKCSSLANKRVTPHSLRHTMAMELLQAGVEPVMIALWLGHESVTTTQIYLHANLALKESILAKTAMPDGTPGRYRPDDQLLHFLKSL